MATIRDDAGVARFRPAVRFGTPIAASGATVRGALMAFTPIAPDPSWSPSGAQRSVTCERIRERRTEVLAALIRERIERPPRRVLVVGCGSGVEAAVLAGELQAKVVGIDLEPKFDP